MIVYRLVVRPSRWYSHRRDYVNNIGKWAYPWDRPEQNGWESASCKWFKYHVLEPQHPRLFGTVLAQEVFSRDALDNTDFTLRVPSAISGRPFTVCYSGSFLFYTIPSVVKPY